MIGHVYVGTHIHVYISVDAHKCAKGKKKKYLYFQKELTVLTRTFLVGVVNVRVRMRSQRGRRLILGDAHRCCCRLLMMRLHFCSLFAPAE